MFTTFNAGELKTLDNHLATRSYLGGFKQSQDDALAYAIVGHMKHDSSLVHVARWVRHMASYTDAERKAFPGAATLVKATAPAAKKEAVDLFGSDDEDDEETKAELAKQQAELDKKAADKDKKPKDKRDKSMIVLHVKPYDDEIDMAKVMEQIPLKIQFEGLQWGTGELQEVCFGLKRAALPCVVIDDLCSIDEVCEKICDTFADDVQSCDIHSFNKLG